MSHGLLWLDASFRVPVKAFRDKVYEKLVVAVQNLLQRLGRRPASSAFRVDHGPWRARRIEEELLARATLDQVLVWDPKHFHDACQLLLLILPGEYRIASIELGNDAAETPNINGCRVDCVSEFFGYWNLESRLTHMVVHPKYDLWRAVETALNVRVDLFVFKAAGTEVNDLDTALPGMVQQNVLWLEIAVDDPVLPHEHERPQDLDSESANEARREASEAVGLDQLIQVDAEQLHSDAEM